MNEKSRVQNAVETMTQAFHDKNMQGIFESYEDTATVAFEPGVAVSDRKGIEAGFSQFFEVDPRFEYAGHQVLVHGDLAVHLAPWRMTGRGPDGSAIEQKGLSVAVLRKGEDGAWRLVIDNPHGQVAWEKAEGRT